MKPKNRNVLLCIIGSAASITGAIFAYKEGKEQKKSDSNPEPEEKTKTEKIKEFAKDHWKSLACEGIAIGCSIGNCVSNSKSLAGSAAIIGGGIAAFEDYRKELIKRDGPKKDQDISDAVIKEHEEAKKYIKPFPTECEYVKFETMNDDGETISNCFDKEDCGKKIKFYDNLHVAPLTDDAIIYDLNRQREFSATPLQVLNAEFLFNRNFVINGDTNLYSFYKYLGYPMDPEFAEYAKNTTIEFPDGVDPNRFWIDFSHTKDYDVMGNPYYIIDCNILPWKEEGDFTFGNMPTAE